jgi:predicted Ser/Thr protein kinase
MTDTGAANTIMIKGRYQVFLDQEIGSGGMSIVYRGFDIRARCEIAAKTLKPVYQNNPEDRRRFRDEGRMMRFAAHPGLVRHLDQDDRWIAMELVSGRNLKQLVEEEGPQPVPEVVRILHQVSQPLQLLHQREFVHLDLKPQNIIIADSGKVTLIDLGLAQSFAPRQDTRLGTAAYLAPEQGRHEAVDNRTDIYSLGCVVFELLTGRPPFDAPPGPDQKNQIIEKHISEEPVPPSAIRPDLPFWIDDVVDRAMEKVPAHRFASVTAFADAALNGLAGDPVEADGDTRELSAVPHQRRFSLRWRGRERSADGDDEPDVSEFLEDDTPSVARRAWVAGARAARRTRPRHRTLWRLAMYVAILNLVLGTVLVARDGPGALVERFLDIAPGTTTKVENDVLNLREGPGIDTASIVLLVSGDEVTVTGLSEIGPTESDEQATWWPVRAELDGITYEGWVWDGGLTPNTWTGGMSFMQGIVDNVQGARDAIGNGFDRLGDRWPF